MENGHFVRRIIHVDMDAFYAACEVRDDPRLAGLPLIIGALPSERGVVATCSYEAREFGVRSAMSIKEAHRLCPHGHYMRPNMDKYADVSRRLHDIWGSYTDLVDHVSLDEGYLDVSYSAHLFGGASKIGRDIKMRTKGQLGLNCSVGIGYNMLAAKIASEEDKPNGYCEILDEAALLELIGGRDVRILPGVGAVTARRLAKGGIITVADLAGNVKAAREALGSFTEQAIGYANGVDNRPVGKAMPRKSIGHEQTFQKDLSDFEQLRLELWLLSKQLGFKLRLKRLFAKTVTLKITYFNMVQVTRSKSGTFAQSPRELFKIALELLGKADKKPIRLLGISASNLVIHAPEQLDLFNELKDDKRERLDDVVFNLQYKHGIDIIKSGLEITCKQKSMT